MDTKTRVKLMQSECRVWKMRLPSPTTVTFFRNPPGANTTDIVDTISKRLNKIVRCNPWLTGRLVTSDGGMYLEYDEDATMDLDVAYNTGIRPDAAIYELASHPDLADAYVLSAVCLVDLKVQRLFKVKLIIEPDGTFVLVVSLSHTIGDGCTYYKIYAMFDDNVEPEELVVHRDHRFDKDFKTILHHEEAWHNTLYKEIGAVKGVVSNIFVNPKFGYNSVDLNELQTIKEKSDKIISTNDIICSWIYKKLNCSFGLMYVDFRGRIDYVGKNHAGNYSDEVLVSPQEFAQPSSIRTMVSELSKGLKPCSIVPTSLQTVNFNCCMVTNWCRFYHSLTLGGVQSIHHLPYFNKKQYTLRHWRSCAVIFKPNINDVAVLWLSNSDSDPMMNEKLFNPKV